MKKIHLLICSVLLTTVAFSNPRPDSEKVHKVFNLAFPMAEDAHWSDTLGVFQVNFKLNDVQTIITYDEDANCLSSRRYLFSGKSLPLDIQSSLAKKFPTRTIYGLIEQTNGNIINYHVMLEDATSWITVKIDSMHEIEITEKYKKA